MVSKWVGDLMNISLYDLHVEIKCIPFVEVVTRCGVEWSNGECQGACGFPCWPCIVMREKKYLSTQDSDVLPETSSDRTHAYVHKSRTCTCMRIILCVMHQQCDSQHRRPTPRCQWKTWVPKMWWNRLLSAYPGLTHRHTVKTYPGLKLYTDV